MSEKLTCDYCNERLDPEEANYTGVDSEQDGYELALCDDCAHEHREAWRRRGITLYIEKGCEW